MAITQLRGSDAYSIVRAKFIGKNKSLGYHKNQVYELRIYKNSNMLRREGDGGGLCVYSSISSFLENWSDVKIIKP